MQENIRANGGSTKRSNSFFHFNTFLDSSRLHFLLGLHKQVLNKDCIIDLPVLPMCTYSKIFGSAILTKDL